MGIPISQKWNACFAIFGDFKGIPVFGEMLLFFGDSPKK